MLRLAPVAVVALACAVGVVACGGDDDASSTSGDTSSNTTVETTEPAQTITKDIVYLEMDGHEYLVDVYAPVGDGPWPVVVALHGAPVYKGHSQTTVIAKAAAQAGMLVFAPNWVAQWPNLSDLDADFIRSQEPAYRCALAFAQQEAASYGGDANRSVVYGHSGGATSGSHLLLQATTELPPGCLAQTLPFAPVGAVLGDAEYFLHNRFWDGAFDTDPDEMQAFVAEIVDPASWPADMATRFHLWAAAEGTFGRSVDETRDESDWLAQRDPDGTIRADLDELDELDDGIISYIDHGLLLTTRLQHAGIDATFDLIPGGHDAPDKAPDIVAYLLDAAGAPT